MDDCGVEGVQHAVGDHLLEVLVGGGVDEGGFEGLEEGRGVFGRFRSLEGWGGLRVGGCVRKD